MQAPSPPASHAQMSPKPPAQEDIANTYGGLAVDDSQLDGDLQALPVSGGLGDVLADLLGGLHDESDRSASLAAVGKLSTVPRTCRTGTTKA